MTERRSFAVDLRHEGDAPLLDQLETWFLYANVLWVVLATLLSIALPCIVMMALVRAFS
ncbi:hypothetical protein GR702_17620 [Novosphingobium sp. FGD1]|uniref:Uncharacterized protein n=1 Tax=Novosphingobium silvae TaxID=2692619 RepID=A0A7X4GJ39_9SPHN|nr:hypothetical protein [Novosphingobium silvae]MYL99583.1 hypothetical protein [Novosphingobium silvae]